MTLTNLPTVGGSKDAWGQALNDILTALDARLAVIEGGATGGGGGGAVDPPLEEPDTPVDPPAPGVGADWYLVDITPPPGAVYYNGSSSLAAALTALPTGGTLVLDYNGVRTENINVLVNGGITVQNAPGKRPWVNGEVRIRCASDTNTAKFYGLSIRWDTPSASGHMLKLDGGSIEWAYSEITQQGNSVGCYTLLRPGQTLKNWRIHHCWIHHNPGVSSHNGNQDHGLYMSGETANQNGRVDHCLIEEMPRGRNIKIGGPSGGGGAIGGIRIDHCTLRKGHGPSNGQVSNGTTNTTWENLLLMDSGASTNLTDGSGSAPGNIYRNCKGDSTVGPNTTNFDDAGGNTNNVSVGTLGDFETQGGLGYGHLEGGVPAGGGGGAPPPASVYVGRVGSTAQGSETNTIPVTVSKAVAAGQTLVLAMAHAGTGRTVTSVVDSRGNTWSIAGSHVNGTTLKSWLIVCTVGTALQVGDVITVTMSGLVTTAGVSVDEFNDVTSLTPHRTGAGANDTTVAAATLTSALTSTTSTKTLLLTAVGFSGTSATITSSTGDTALAPVAPAAAASNRGVALLYRVVNSGSAGSVSITLSPARIACAYQAALPSA